MRRFAALLAVVFLAACSNEIDTSTRPEAIVGTYGLLTYGGSKLPTLLSSDANGSMELLSGQLVIGADKSWSETRVYRVTEASGVQQIAFGSSGSWTMLGEGAFMQFNDKVRGYQFTGMAAGGSVTLNLNDGATVIYSHDK